MQREQNQKKSFLLNLSKKMLTLQVCGGPWSRWQLWVTVTWCPRWYEKPFLKTETSKPNFSKCRKNLIFSEFGVQILDNKSLFFLHVNERDELFQYPNILPPFLPLDYLHIMLNKTKYLRLRLYDSKCNALSFSWRDHWKTN